MPTVVPGRKLWTTSCCTKPGKPLRNFRELSDNDQFSQKPSIRGHWDPLHVFSGAGPLRWSEGRWGVAPVAHWPHDLWVAPDCCMSGAFSLRSARPGSSSRPAPCGRPDPSPSGTPKGSMFGSCLPVPEEVRMAFHSEPTARGRLSLGGHSAALEPPSPHWKASAPTAATPSTRASRQPATT